MLAYRIVIPALLIICVLLADRSTCRADDPTVPRFIEGPSFRLSRHAPLAGVLTFATDLETTPSVHLWHGADRQKVPVDPAPATLHRIPIFGLRANREYSLEVKVAAGSNTAPAPSVQFRTAPLPDDFPSIRVTVSQPDRMEPGVTLFSLFRWENDAASNSFGVFVAVDAEGEIVWYYRVGSPAAALHLLNNGDFQFIHGVKPKFIRQIDRLGNTIREFHATGLGDTPQPETISVDVDTFHHDFAPEPDGSLFALSTEVRQLDRFPRTTSRPRRSLGPAHVIGDVIVEIAPNGEVRRRWPLLDLLDPVRIGHGSLEGFWDRRGYEHIESGTRDWSHANTVIRDPKDECLVVSLRHQDAIIKIDPETSAVRWILGTRAGWRPPFVQKVLKPTAPMEWQYHQHGVKFTPHGTLLLFDNGNARAIPPARPMPPTRAYSRAVEYLIDETEMTVTEVWSYGGADSPDQFFSPFLCDADWLPRTGNVLITDGARVSDENGEPADRSPGDSQWARLLEVTHDESPEIVWELMIDDRSLRPETGWSVYRSERIPSLYPDR